MSENQGEWEYVGEYDQYFTYRKKGHWANAIVTVEKTLADQIAKRGSNLKGKESDET